LISGDKVKTTYENNFYSFERCNPNYSDSTPATHYFYNKKKHFYMYNKQTNNKINELDS